MLPDTVSIDRNSWKQHANVHYMCPTVVRWDIYETLLDFTNSTTVGLRNHHR